MHSQIVGKSVCVTSALPRVSRGGGVTGRVCFLRGRCPGQEAMRSVVCALWEWLFWNGFGKGCGCELHPNLAAEDFLVCFLGMMGILGCCERFVVLIIKA